MKSCPFCGGNASVYRVTDDEEGFVGYFICCDDCDCRTTVFDTQDEAKRVWGKRVPSKRENDLVEIMKNLIKARQNEMIAKGEYISNIHSAENLLKSYED